MTGKIGRPRILITGSSGTIGTVLCNGLADDYEIVRFDLPKQDALDITQLLAKAKGCDAIIHLAWSYYPDHQINTTNSTMFLNAYLAALKKSVPKIIMASSVHADSYQSWTGPQITTTKAPTPDSLYGAHKVFMESVGTYYATQGLDVSCVRFGGVNSADRPIWEPETERGVWLSHRDCVSLIKTILKSTPNPYNFEIIYAVSNNHSRQHDYSNSYGWTPQDNADLIS